MSLLSELLYRTRWVDERGFLDRPWREWLAALVERAGGVGEMVTIRDLLAMIERLGVAEGLRPPVPLPLPDRQPIALQLAMLPGTPRGHLRGGPRTTPSVTVGVGAGAGAVAAIAGTDNAGTVRLTTQRHQDRHSHTVLAQVTFAVPFPSPPVCLLSPANEAAYGLDFGYAVEPGQAVMVMIRQEDVQPTGFPLRCGVRPLPGQGTTYAWNYLAIGR